MHVLAPHLKFPLRVEMGRLGVTPQDTVHEIACCVALAIVTPRGQRSLNTDFGSVDLPFILQGDVGEIIEQVLSSEPRAKLLVTSGFKVTDEATNLIIQMAVARQGGDTS